MNKVTREIRNAVQLGEWLLCDLREFETSGRSEWAEDIVTIICKDNKEEIIHRFILQLTSPVFARILSESEWTGSISLDISSELLRIIIDFIYGSHDSRFSTSQVVELFAAAHRFEIEALATSIQEAVDAEFFNSFVLDQDSLLGVSDCDIGRVIDLFNQVVRNADQEKRLSEKLRAWAGTDRDRLPKFMEVFDALSRMHLTREPLNDEKVIPLWMDDKTSKLKLCSLRIRANGGLSLHETGKTIPNPLNTGRTMPGLLDTGRFVIYGELLIRLEWKKNLKAFRFDPLSPEGLTELSRLEGGFLDLCSTPDGRMFTRERRTIYWIACDDGVLTKTRVGEAKSWIQDVYFIEGNSDRDACFAIHEGPIEKFIAFMDCHTGIEKPSLLRDMYMVQAVSSDGVFCLDVDDMFLLSHNFRESFDRRSIGKRERFSGVKFIGPSRVLLLGFNDPADGTASVALIDALNGTRSVIQKDCEEFRFANIIPNQSES